MKRWNPPHIDYRYEAKIAWEYPITETLEVSTDAEAEQKGRELNEKLEQRASELRKEVHYSRVTKTVTFVG